MSKLAERLEAAVHVLVTDGPVKQRLMRAYAEHLEPLRDAELPPRLAEPFARLHDAMHRVAPMGTTACRVKASVQKMSAAEASGHAAVVVGLYAELLRSGQREPLKVVDSASEPIAATSS